MFNQVTWIDLLINAILVNRKKNIIKTLKQTFVLVNILKISKSFCEVRTTFVLK